MLLGPLSIEHPSRQSSRHARRIKRTLRAQAVEHPTTGFHRTDQRLATPQDRPHTGFLREDVIIRTTQLRRKRSQALQARFARFHVKSIPLVSRPQLETPLTQRHQPTASTNPDARLIPPRCTHGENLALRTSRLTMPATHQSRRTITPHPRHLMAIKSNLIFAIDPLRLEKFTRAIDKRSHIEATTSTDFKTSQPPIDLLLRKFPANPHLHIGTRRLRPHLRPLGIISRQPHDRHRMPQSHPKAFFNASVKLQGLRQKFANHRTGLEVFSGHRIHQARRDPRCSQATLTIDHLKIHTAPPQLPRKAAASQTLPDNRPRHTAVTHFGHKASFGSLHEES